MKPVSGDISTHLMMWRASKQVDWAALARLQPRDDEDWERLGEIIYGYLDTAVKDETNQGLNPNDNMGEERAIQVDYDQGEGWLEYWYDDWPNIRVKACYWSEADDQEYDRGAGQFTADRFSTVDHWGFVMQLEALLDRFGDGMRDWDRNEDEEG